MQERTSTTQGTPNKQTSPREQNMPGRHGDPNKNTGYPKWEYIKPEIGDQGPIAKGEPPAVRPGTPNRLNSGQKNNIK